MIPAALNEGPIARMITLVCPVPLGPTIKPPIITLSCVETKPRVPILTSLDVMPVVRS